MDAVEITRRLKALDALIGQFARDTRETANARRHLTEARLWWQEYLVKEASVAEGKEQGAQDGPAVVEAA